MNPNEISPDLPSDVLQQRARAQRVRMHESVSELREQVRDTINEKLDVKRYASEYAWETAGVAAFLSLLVGFGTAGMIKRIVR